jgi:hypothetical protein
MEVTFYNVTITIEATSPEAAYERLCGGMAEMEAEYQTDTFSTYGGEEKDCRDTKLLFPKDV